MIDYIEPQGMISLLGVSENPVAINTRMVLEKGIIFAPLSLLKRNESKNKRSLEK